jgi:hypothetical protein
MLIQWSLWIEKPRPVLGDVIVHFTRFGVERGPIESD